MTPITIIQGDLLALDVDAIVNPANGFLRHGAGLARKIEERATGAHMSVDPSKRRASIEARGGYKKVVAAWKSDHANAQTVPTGSALMTSAGTLPFKGVIHAVGPVWGGGGFYEAELLASAHFSAIHIARFRGWSLGIPAISCGLFRFPVELAAPIALKCAAAWADTVPITFALLEDAHFDAYAYAAIECGAKYRIVR